jgi:iron-sulfur cluster repair protein YtfE (RIC family)
MLLLATLKTLQLWQIPKVRQWSLRPRDRHARRYPTPPRDESESVRQYARISGWQGAKQSLSVVATPAKKDHPLTGTDLHTRTDLPEALRVLLKELPRSGWDSHPKYSGLIRFWLDRHMMFRSLLERMGTDVEHVLDKSIAPAEYARRLSRLGGTFINELHGHHQIEDAHYFPFLEKLDTRVSRGFVILDKDHHALDAVLARFTGRANDVLQGVGGKRFIDLSAAMKSEIDGFETLLNRHLTDEEDLIVPVLLKYAPPSLS